MQKYLQHLPPDFGSTLTALRRDASVNQTDVAAKLGVNASKISRIEGGLTVPSNTVLKGYIDSIGTRAARDYLRFLKVDWKFVSRPPYDHPNRPAIYKAERYLQKLEGFLNDESVPKLLTGQALMYKDALEREATYLFPTRHSLSFVGEIGVGKTTALCLLTGLVLPEKKASLLQRVVLDIAGGRTTICEVRVEAGSRFGINVEPHPEADIFKLVEEMCIGLLDRDSVKGDPDPTVSEEIARALRNMAGLRRPPIAPGEKAITPSPIAELVRNFPTREALFSEFSARLQLWKRTRRDLWYDGPTKHAAGLNWLKQTFRTINYGLVADVSLPQRINVTVPSELFCFPPYEIEAIDTKGVDQSAIRPDLRSRLDDVRTLTVLCSRFNSAPDVLMQGFIRHLVETGSDLAFRERGVLLVLPRPEEAKAIKDDEGELVRTEQEGYAVKHAQVEAALKRIGVAHVPVFFFNANSDDPRPIISELLKRVRSMRTRHARHVSDVCRAVDTLFEDGERAKIELAQQDVNKSLRIFVEQHRELPPRKRRGDDALIDAVRSAHPRTVWASTRRSGAWSNLDVYYYLGAGARADARLRASAAFDGLGELVRNKLGDPDLQPSHGFLKELQSNVEFWRENFFAAVTSAGTRTFRRSLERAVGLWSECENLYGMELRYRNECAQRIRSWFDHSERDGLHAQLEASVSKAWNDEFLEKLEVVITSPEDSDTTDEETP